MPKDIQDSFVKFYKSFGIVVFYLANSCPSMSLNALNSKAFPEGKHTVVLACFVEVVLLDVVMSKHGKTNGLIKLHVLMLV